MILESITRFFMSKQSLTGRIYQLIEEFLYIDTLNMAAKVAELATKMAAQNTFVGHIVASTFHTTIIVMNVTRLWRSNKLLVACTNPYTNLFDI
jgi:hypothetical protein